MYLYSVRVMRRELPTKASVIATEFSVTVKSKDTQYHLTPNFLNQIAPKQHWWEQWAEVSRKRRNQNNTPRSLLAPSSLYCSNRPGPLRRPQNKGRTSQHIISRFLNLEESTRQAASATLRRISLRPLWIDRSSVCDCFHCSVQSGIS